MDPTRRTPTTTPTSPRGAGHIPGGSHTDAEKNISSTHEITQNDHLNKKLLTAFLARINGVAEKIIDPSGKGETLGKVYTDDVMMDRILRRVDSNPPD